MIRNLIFDMGQVLIHWSPQLLTADLSLSQEDRQTLHREVFGGIEWISLDHGTMTEEQAARSVCGRLPEQLRPVARELIFSWWVRPLHPMEGMEDLLRELKDRGYRLYLLSNASLRLRTYFPRIPGSDCFEGLLVSAEEMLLKPQQEIYLRLLERFSLQPEECFFVDDSPANVEGALCTGIRGSVFHGDVEALRRELQQANIL